MDAEDFSGDGRGYMTEERRLIQDTAREFAMKEVLPVANELDPVQGEIPMEIASKLRCILGLQLRS